MNLDNNIKKDYLKTTDFFKSWEYSSIFQSIGNSELFKLIQKYCSRYKNI